MAYRVIASTLMQERIRSLTLEAILLHQTDVGACLQEFLQKVTSNPQETGEIKYHTPTGMPVHLIVCPPLAINYAIHSPSEVIWVVKVERLFAADE